MGLYGAGAATVFMFMNAYSLYLRLTMDFTAGVMSQSALFTAGVYKCVSFPKPFEMPMQAACPPYFCAAIAYARFENSPFACIRWTALRKWLPSRLKIAIFAGADLCP